MSNERQLGDAPVEQKFQRQMMEVATAVDRHFNGTERPRRVGFVLMCFEFGDNEGGRVNYMSNAGRQDVIATLRHQLARFEGMPDMQGHG